MNSHLDALQGNPDPAGDAAEAVGAAESAVAADPMPAALGDPAHTIAVWRSYLPEDCVATMIKMGWHRST
jgi:hypothetical protein